MGQEREGRGGVVFTPLRHPYPLQRPRMGVDDGLLAFNHQVLTEVIKPSHGTDGDSLSSSEVKKMDFNYAVRNIKVALCVFQRYWNHTTLRVTMPTRGVKLRQLYAHLRKERAARPTIYCKDRKGQPTIN